MTLVEMLVAIAITLLIMSAVVTVFANVSGSVTRRRATIEMASQLRNVRETLARDLEGATCPAVPTQSPESNVGYLEVIEGPQNDYYPTPWIYDNDGSGVGDDIGSVQGIDLSLSSLPGSNLGANVVSNEEGRGLLLGAPINNAIPPEEVKTDGRGLGDADDILMLTVRNETDPFVGRIPPRTGANTPATGTFDTWFRLAEEIESPLAEVVWFAVENPVDPQRTFAFGEPGYRNIYRRALLILPGLDYGIPVSNGSNTVQAGPGVVRVLGQGIARTDVSQAIASLIAFQERYDLSVRLEWDPTLPDSIVENANDMPGRWVLQANTLSDLTRRENRFEHHGYVGMPQTRRPTIDRYFPFAVSTAGRLPQASSSLGVSFVVDPELSTATGRPGASAEFTANTVELFAVDNGNGVIDFPASDDDVLAENRRYDVRPFAIANHVADFPATARAILNEDGNVVHVTRGLAPLGGDRRGDDLMITGALAFDLKVYDPGAPVYAYFLNGDTTDPPEHLLTPADPAWAVAFERDGQSGGLGAGPTTNPNFPFRLETQGAYVDLGYGRTFLETTENVIGQIPPAQRFAPRAIQAFGPADGLDLLTPRFLVSGRLGVNSGAAGRLDFTALYPTFDTWSNHYESDGINQDLDDTSGLLLPNDPDTGLLSNPVATGVPAVDEGVDGFDTTQVYINQLSNGTQGRVQETRFGPDDPTERETPPPYDTALRGLQATLRVYEQDSRQIREVSVRESFVPE